MNAPSSLVAEISRLTPNSYQTFVVTSPETLIDYQVKIHIPNSVSQGRAYIDLVLPSPLSLPQKAAILEGLLRRNFSSHATWGADLGANIIRVLSGSEPRYDYWAQDLGNHVTTIVREADIVFQILTTTTDPKELTAKLGSQFA